MLKSKMKGRDIGIFIRRLCEYKEVEIIEVYACVKYIYMLLSFMPRISVSLGVNDKYIWL